MNEETQIRCIELSEDTRKILIDVQRQLMRDWSEDQWCAQWMMGLEEEMWHGTNKEMTWYDEGLVAVHEISRLTGVWCTYDDDVPLAEWRAQHAPPLIRMADRDPTPEQQAALDRRIVADRAHLERISKMLSN